MSSSSQVPQRIRPNRNPKRHLNCRHSSRDQCGDSIPSGPTRGGAGHSSRLQIRRPLFVCAGLDDTFSPDVIATTSSTPFSLYNPPPGAVPLPTPYQLTTTIIPTQPNNLTTLPHHHHHHATHLTAKMAITSAVSDLVASVYELFASFIGAIYTIVHSFLAGIANLFAGVFHLFADVFQGVFDLVGGVGKFVAGKSSPFHDTSPWNGG